MRRLTARRRQELLARERRAAAVARARAAAIERRRRAAEIARERTRLLERLRRESELARLSHEISERSTPGLLALARAARTQPGPSIVFGGIVFRCRFGWARHVLCPDTGTAILSVGGGTIL
jgi:hypothetical protein